jgi:hypothetical protein
MAKVHASEVKRVISVVQNRRVLDFVNHVRPHGPEFMANQRKLAERIRPLLAKGIELEKIDKIVAENRAEQQQLLEKEKADAYKLLPRMDTLRHGIDERLKASKLANLPNINPPKFITLDTPFLIWAQPSNVLTASHIEPGNSTAQINYKQSSVNLEPDNTDTVTVGFYFQWENSSSTPVLLANIASHLAVKGRWELSAASTFIFPNVSSAIAKAQLNIFKWWNQPPTSPLFEDSQEATILELDCDGGLIFKKGENVFEWVFNNYDVKYSSLAVPPKGLVVFEVLLFTGISFLSGLPAGLMTADITMDDSDSGVLCPFVQLEVRDAIQHGPPI